MLENNVAGDRLKYQSPKLEMEGRYGFVTGLSGAPFPGDSDYVPDFLDGVEKGS
jgi:hypothetical protein